MKNEDITDIDQLNEVFDNHELLKLNFQIKHVKNGTYQMKTRALNKVYGSVQDEWLRMGLSENLNKQDIEYLKQICTPHITIRTCEVTDGVLNFETLLQPEEIQYIHLVYEL
jgi:beta-xylosidase